MRTEIDMIEALTSENEQLRETIRSEAEAGELGWQIANDHLAERNALQAENERLVSLIKRLEGQLVAKHHRIDDLLERVADQRMRIEGLCRRLRAIDNVATTISRAIKSEEGAYAVRVASALGGQPLD